MTCTEVKQLLMDLALDEAGPEQRTQARAHVEGCEACRAELAGLAMARKLLVQGLPEEEVPRRIAFVAAAPAGLGWLGWMRRRSVAIPACALAAALLLIGTLALARTRVVVEKGRWEIAFGVAAVAGRPAGADAGRAAEGARSLAAGARQPAATPASHPAGAPAGALTREQAVEILAAALRENEARQKADTVALVEAASSRLDRRHFTALNALAHQMSYFERTQNIFYKESEGNRQAIETVASRLPAQQGGRP